jgi:steroid delta-isomerase-like uncharacterized protein
MSIEENKAQTRRYVDELWNKGNLDIINEFISPDLVYHNAPQGLPQNREGFRQMVTMFQAAYPDLHINIEDLVAEGDKVVVRWSARGTHKGELMGILPTNKQVTVHGIGLFRLAGNKQVERWEEMDALGMMQQLGAVPQPELAKK